MDKALLIVYGWIALFGLLVYLLVFILGCIIFFIFRKNPDKIYEYFKNLVYGAAGGLIILILTDLRAFDWKSYTFWSVNMPLALVLLAIFILLGCFYLYILEKFYKWIKAMPAHPETRSSQTRATLPTTRSAETLQNYLEKHSYNLVALSVFLLIATTIPFFDKGILNKPFAMLAAGASYCILLDLFYSSGWPESLTLGLFKGFILLFTLFLPVWVILNLIIPLDNAYGAWVMVIWILFIIIPPIKMFFPRN
ncbi:MAG: hypothetical protein Q7R87_04240 [Nanoarchaeota archaeon]|nr:hypothetical protein [Nanoarchaeota archaeon]